jgi:hypothetical protein
MPLDRGRGLTKLWVAAGWPAHRRLHPESITTARRRGRLVAGVADWPLERSLLPIFSSAGHNLFAARSRPRRCTTWPPCPPYVRTGSIGDNRQSVGTTAPDYLWGWLVHRRGESRDASSRNKRIRPRPGSAAGYLSRPLAPDWAAFPLGGFSAPFCLASGLSATDDVFPIQQQFFFFGQQVQCRIDAGGRNCQPNCIGMPTSPGTSRARAGRT